MRQQGCERARNSHFSFRPRRGKSRQRCVMLRRHDNVTRIVGPRPMDFETKTLNVRQAVDAVYRDESRRVFATLVRLLGDFDLAEEAMHDAFASAVEQWPRDGLPANPRAWLVSAGRFKAIDAMRRRARFDASLETLADRLNADAQIAEPDDDGIEDDRLRLIFTCC